MAGMDPKIMAAVFASIAAIAVGTGGTGTLQDFQGMTPSELVGKFTESPSGIISDLRSRPDPTNSVLVTAQISSKETVSGAAKSLKVNNFESIASGSRNISSDSEIAFHDFSGSLEVEKNNLSEIKGTSNGFSSSGVTVSESMDVSGVTDAEIIVLSNVSKEKISLGAADVRIESREDSTVIEKEDTSLGIDSFSGDITYFSENSSLILDGQVNKVEAGGASFSG